MMKILDMLGKTKKAIGGLIAIFIVCALIFFAGTRFASNSDEPEITSTGITQQLQDIEELATLSYNYTKVGEFSNSLQFNGWDIPLTQKSFLTLKTTPAAVMPPRLVHLSLSGRYRIAPEGQNLAYPRVE